MLVEVFDGVTEGVLVSVGLAVGVEVLVKVGIGVTVRVAEGLTVGVFVSVGTNAVYVCHGVGEFSIAAARFCGTITISSARAATHSIIKAI